MRYAGPAVCVFALLLIFASLVRLIWVVGALDNAVDGLGVKIDQLGVDIREDIADVRKSLRSAVSGLGAAE